MRIKYCAWQTNCVCHYTVYWG